MNAHIDFRQSVVHITRKHSRRTGYSLSPIIFHNMDFPKYMIVVGKRGEEVGEGKGEYEGSREKRRSSYVMILTGEKTR